MKKLTYGAVSILLSALLTMPFAAASVTADNTAVEGDMVEATVENISAYASGTVTASGTFTTGVNWAVYSDGTLEITGSGDIPDHPLPEDVPWRENIVNIKSIVVGEGITAIGVGTFRNLGNVLTATLPSTLKSIGAYAFDYCDSLQTVTIKNGLTTVGEYAFGYCRSLQRIALPETVTSIGIYAFYKCTSLESAALPSNMAGIPMGLFENCYMLKSIDWPTNVTYIGESAFAGCCSLNYVNVPNTVTAIGANAFAECEWLYSLSMDTNVTEIGADVVANSTYATLVVRKDSVAHTYAKNNSVRFQYFYEPYIIAGGICGENLNWDLYDTGDLYITGSGAMHDAWTVTEHAAWYDYRDDIKNVYVASGATSIGAYAFYNCQNIVKIEIPSTVSSFGVYAFAYCEKLKDITLPSTVTVFSEGVFLNCKSIEYLNPSSNTTSVGAYALAGCEKLTSFKLGSKVKTIGTYAFYDCRSIKNIDIAYSSGLFDYSNPSIGNYAFVNCTSLEKFVVSSNNKAYKTDSSGALLNRTSTTLIAYPAGNPNTAYTIGSSVTTINPFAFANADNLEFVTISSKVKTIGAYAFYECDNLFTIEIPTNVTSIGDMAFYGCEMMDVAIINSTKVTLGADVFYHTNEYFTIYGTNNSPAEAYAKKNLYPFVSLSPTETELVEGIGKWTGGKETVVATNDYLHFGIRATNSSQDKIQTVNSFEVGTTYKLTFKYRNNDLNVSTMRMYVNGAGADGAYIQLKPNLVDVVGTEWKEAEYTFTPESAGNGLIFFNGEGRLSIASFDFDDIVISVVEPIEGSAYTAGEVIFSTNEADAYKPYYVDLKYVTTTGSLQSEVTEYMESAAEGETEGGNLVYEMFDPIPLKAGYAAVSAKFRVSNSYTTRVLTEIKNTLNYTHKNYNGADIVATIYFDNGEYINVPVSDDAADTFDMAPYIWTELTFPFELDRNAGIKKVEFNATGYDIVVDGTVVKSVKGSPYELDVANYTLDDVQLTTTSEPFEVWGLTVSGTLSGEVTKHVFADPVVENIVTTGCLDPITYDEVVYCAVCGEEFSRTTVTAEAPGHKPAAAKRENVVQKTCTTDGSYDEVVYCSVCNEELERKTTTVKATGHIFVNNKCYVCSESRCAAEGHKPGTEKKENVVPETCTTDGSYDTVVYCSVCNEEVSRNTTVVPAAGHTYTNNKCDVCGVLRCEVEGHKSGAEKKENVVPETCTTDGSYDAVVYCSVCNEELSRNKVVVSAPGHAFVNNKCTVCGEMNFTVIEGFETNNLTNKTGGKATVTAPVNGWIVGENTFNVSCTFVCRVYISNDGGVTYQKLSATANANGGYDFTATLTADSKIVIRIFGDMNGNGVLQPNDITMLKRIIKGTYNADAATRLIADLNGNGALQPNDITMLKRIIKGTYSGHKW